MEPNQHHYSLMKELGHGSFGTVWQVTNGSAIFAMKVINDPNQSAIQEVKILKLAKHPNIVRYFDSFLENGSLKIIMEFADQGTLSTQTLIWTEETVWGFLAQMGSALTYLHSIGIIHRDLKPENILCVSAGNNQIMFKIADFGIAKLVDAIRQGNHYANTYAGTYCYMAPEVLNKQPYAFSADIWSLGAVLSFLCNNNRHLFASNDQVKQLMEIIDPLPDHYSSDLQGLVTKMLNVNTLGRPGASMIYREAQLRNQNS